MGRWRVEASRDGRAWDEVAAFFGADCALTTFDFELARERHAHLRLVSPDGVVEERAVLRHAPAG